MKSAPAPKNELGSPQKPFAQTFSAFTAIRAQFAPPSRLSSKGNKE